MFGKKDLRSGDVVVERAGYIGIVVECGGDLIIVYENGGYDELDEFDDDLMNASYLEAEKKFDIMSVYRGNGGNSFDMYYEGKQLFRRDSAWEDTNIPIRMEKIRKSNERWEAERAKELAAMPKKEGPAQEMIHVMVQAFYGNRVITMVDTKVNVTVPVRIPRTE